MTYSIELMNSYFGLLWGGGKIKRRLILVLLVTIFLSISAMSAADIDNNGTSTSSLEDVGGTTQTKSDTSIESNSIENQVSNEYETITNVN